MTYDAVLILADSGLTLTTDPETRSALITCLASAGAAGFVAICYELRRSNIPKTFAQRLGDIMIGGAAGFMVGAVFGDQFSLVVTMGFGGFAGASGSRLFDIAKMNLEAGFANVVQRMFGITGTDVTQTMDHLRQQDDLQDAIEDKPHSDRGRAPQRPRYDEDPYGPDPYSQDPYGQNPYGSGPGPDNYPGRDDGFGSGSYELPPQDMEPPPENNTPGGFDPSNLPDLPQPGEMDDDSNY